MRSNIDKIRKEILFLKKNFLKSSIKKKINLHLSSLIPFRYLIFLNLNLKKNLNSEILKKNFFYQLKNFFYIRKFSAIEFFGDFSYLKKNEKKKIIISWSYDKNFKGNGAYTDPYFKISSKDKKYLWVLIHEDEVPKNFKKNLILIHPKKGNIFLGTLNLLKYLFKLMLNNKFNINNIIHQFSYDSYLALEVYNFFKKKNLFKNVSSLHIPLESQPFQNTLIDLAKRKKIVTFGYDHTCNPFPFYNNYSAYSPDKLKVHSNCSKKFYVENLNWPINKVEKIPSLRFEKKSKSYFSNKIFLPIMLNSSTEILNRLETLFKDQPQLNTRLFKVCLHPATKNIKKFMKLKVDMIKLQKKYLKIKKQKTRNDISIHVGNTSTIIESLEHGLEAIHITSNDFFDFLSPNLWYSVKHVQLNEHIFSYKLKNFGHCVTFNIKKKRVNL